MTNEVRVRVTAEDQATRVLQNVSKEATGLGKVLGDVGKIAGGFLAANVVAGAGQKVLGFIGDSISAASDLGESMNAVNKIFGESQKVILDWGKNNANAFGLSQREFNQLAVPLGAGLKNAGLDLATTADLTIKLTERASDMASVFNTDVGEALAAIQAGLRGEADPLERFGVGLSAAKVEAHALAMTGKDVASSLTDQEKMLARVDLLMQQTASTQGDFASTSDELANKTRIQQARMEELQATIGEKLIPVQLAITDAKLKMVELLTTKVIPTLEDLYVQHYPALMSIVDTVKQSYENFTTSIRLTTEAIQVGVDWYRTAESALNSLGIKFDEGSVLLTALKTSFSTVIGPINQITFLVDQLTGAFDRLKRTIESIPTSINLPKLPSVPDLNPFRADGGPVMAGGSYIVGERGPEWFVPSQSGVIVPNGGGAQRGGAATPTVINLTMNVGGSILSERDVLRLFNEGIRRGAIRTSPMGIA